MRSQLMMTMGLALAVVVFGATPSSAQARDGGFVSVNLGGGGHYHHETYRAPGHYEYRVERVLVEPAHTDRVWVPPVVEHRHDRFGRHYDVVVRPGYYREICHPARYENRRVRVWVPAPIHHREVYHHDRPRLNLNAFFRF